MLDPVWTEDILLDDNSDPDKKLYKFFTKSD